MHNIYQFLFRNSLIFASILIITAGNIYFFHENQRAEAKQVEKYISLSQQISLSSNADVWFNLPVKDQDPLKNSITESQVMSSQLALIVPSLTPNQPVTEYKSFQVNDRLYYSPKSLTAGFDLTSWLLLHLLVLAPLFVAWRWQLQQEKLKREQSLLENNLNELIQHSAG